MQNQSVVLTWSDRMQSPIGTLSWKLVTNVIHPIYIRYQVFLEKSKGDLYHIVVVDDAKSDKFSGIFSDCLKNLTVYEVHCVNEVEAKAAATTLYAKLTTEKLYDQNSSRDVFSKILSFLPPLARKAVCEYDLSKIKQIEGPVMGDYEDLEIFKEAKVRE